MASDQSPAYKADLKVGDILLEINGQEINTIKDYNVAMADCHDKTASLLIDRKGQTIQLKVSFD